MKIYKNEYIKFLNDNCGAQINTIFESPRTDHITCRKYPFKIEVDITRAPDGDKIETKIYLRSLLIEDDCARYPDSHTNLEELIDYANRFCKEKLHLFCNGIKKWMEFEVR